MLDALREIIDTHSKALPSPIFNLSEDEQQQVVSKLNPYVDFEINQNAQLKGAILRVDGNGLIFISNTDGELLGAETLSDGDLVIGELEDACVLPVPGLESVSLSNHDSTPIVDQFLACIIVLKNIRYKTGLNKDGSYQAVYDGLPYRIGVPIAYYLNVELADG